MDQIIAGYKQIVYSKELEIKEVEVFDLLYFQIERYQKVLPEELISWLKVNICKNDISLTEIEEKLNKILLYFQYCQHSLELITSKDKLIARLNYCGISKETFSKIMQKEVDLNGKVSFEELLNKLKLADGLNSKLKDLKKLLNETHDISQKTFLQKEHEKCISSYLQNKINLKIIKIWDGNITLKQIVRKLASSLGKSKKAFKTFDNLRRTPDNFKQIANLIPIWIMELDDASRIIPLEPNFFDYVVLDEASQCNIAYALPVMYRAKKVIFVGDSEQMRDSTVTFKSNRDFDELATRFKIPEDKQIKATGSSVQSVLDIAYKRGFPDKTLRYHYRSPIELIGFCNENFYKPKGKELFVVNNSHLMYKNTNRTMLVHPIISDWKSEIDDHINVAEAEYILNFFRDLRSTKEYSNKSIGILSFFSKQAGYIRSLFEKAGFKEDVDNYKVTNIEGVQGDEKDIIIYSFVIRKIDQKNKYVPLTGEGGDIKGDINNGRVNVAFSRAREQVHACVSMPIDEIPENIWIKKYLQYVEANGVIDNDTIKLKPFDSYFEESFYNTLRNNLDQKYRIQNQIESCGFKIDFVVSNIASGKRIAIECDGPCHFADEVDEASGMYIESDEHRQRVLESAGWKFFRIKYSEWIDRSFDRKQVIQDIKILID